MPRRCDASAARARPYEPEIVSRCSRFCGPRSWRDQFHDALQQFVRSIYRDIKLCNRQGTKLLRKIFQIDLVFLRSEKTGSAGLVPYLLKLLNVRPRVSVMVAEGAFRDYIDTRYSQPGKECVRPRNPAERNHRSSSPGIHLHRACHLDQCRYARRGRAEV